ncbi:serine/threonine protein kinase [Indivirus ILV1]|uniref:Serine/threonine protein kinase n=1 Tax=Indivirus ILV1 TaxID=1977633 RepID=A0A1V0SDC3_9VIRU|nr:serine/threonine protein kinase [Indivirus ILV1]
MESIGSYKMTREKSSELGRGSFSIVYIGINYLDQDYIKRGEKVAIKVIKTRNLTQKAIDILEDEISIMNLIKRNPHPNIVYCYDVIREEHEVFIIMEYCDSGDLMTIIKRPIKEKYAQFYFCQLANGLKYLDNHNIIHRDIKPKNILLTNNRRVLKIADFGLAKKISDMSLHETICGSPLYMAPEIINHNPYNNQTDLWSIGMILYEMLYGSHPFEKCKSVPELKDQLMKTQIQIPPENTLNKDITQLCLSLLKNLLQKKVNNRINWDDFFKHPWVTNYQYTQQNEYENKLYSVSIGSLAESPSKIPIPQLYQKPKSTPNLPSLKNPRLESLTIIEDFYDKIDRNDKNKRDDQLIFQFDDDNDKKIVIKKILENSSILEEDDGDYNIIDKL